MNTQGEVPKIQLAQRLKGNIAKIPIKINKISSELIKRCKSFEPKDHPSYKGIDLQY
mgnify:CR=1 FL=1